MLFLPAQFLNDEARLALPAWALREAFPVCAGFLALWLLLRLWAVQTPTLQEILVKVIEWRRQFGLVYWFAPPKTYLLRPIFRAECLPLLDRLAWRHDKVPVERKCPSTAPSARSL